MVRSLDLANHIVSTTFPCRFKDAHVTSVKHTRLVKLIPEYSSWSCRHVSLRLVVNDGISGVTSLLDASLLLAECDFLSKQLHIQQCVGNIV